jgi:fluoride ion exporter CrcB/FEX
VEIFLVIIGAIIGIVLGAWVGLKWGIALMPREPWRYWLANVAVALGGIAIATGGQFLGQWWTSVLGLGFMAGGITGLKYGYGSTGVWAIHDRIVGSDEHIRDD